MSFEEPEKVKKIESLSDNTMTCSNKIRHSSATAIILLFFLSKEKNRLTCMLQKKKKKRVDVGIYSTTCCFKYGREKSCTWQAWNE